MSTTTSAPGVLGRARDLVQPAMQAAVDRLDPELRPLAAYHLGWCDEHGTPTPGGGGKGIRPALAVLSAEAAGTGAGADTGTGAGVPGAVAIELVHNFSLLHDDVVDGDRERRHRPTVWALYGVGPAIIAGDALLALAQQTIQGADAPPETRAAASIELADATAAMIAGQAQDMAFESRSDVSTADCLAMVAGKTGALLVCASVVGAVLAGATRPVVGALRRYGAELGVAFQAVDDILGIWGDPGRTGKPRGSDIATRKKSLPVVHALTAGGPESRQLRDLLANGPLDAGAVARGTELVEATGARQATERLAREHLDAACQALDRADLVPTARAELADLARFVVEREF
jgi:geranylgeranyl diphosphate synthase type I